MRNRAPLVLLLILLAVPFIGQSTSSSTDIRVALLEQTQRQQDQHIEYQDKQIDQMRDQLSEVKTELSQILGFGLGIGSLLSIAQLAQIVFTLRGKPR